MNHSEMDVMSLIEYRARVERAASIKDGERIYNGTTEHAQIVIESIFRSADKEVLVLNQSLNDDVYGDENTIDAIEQFLQRNGAKVSALVEDMPSDGWSENLFYRHFGNHENVKILSVPEEAKSLFDFHFTVADKSSYRFEADKSKHAAIAAFGDPPAAENLASIYAKLWKMGVPINENLAS